MTRNLTVNYGVRYDRSVIPAYGTEASVGLQGSIETGDFDFNTGNYILQQLPPLCSVRGHAPCLPSATLPPHVRVATGGKILHGSKDNIGPRVGFAYRVNDRMSVRGGFGISYDNWAAIIQMTQNYQGSWPDTGTLQINDTNTPGTPYTSAQNPFAQNGGNLPAATPFELVQRELHGRSAVEEPLLRAVQPGHRTAVRRPHHSVAELCRLRVAPHGCGRLLQHRHSVHDVHLVRHAAEAGTTGQPYPYTVPQKSWDHSGERLLQRPAGIAGAAVQLRASATRSPIPGARRWMKAATATSALKAAFRRIPTIRRAAAARPASISRRCSPPMRSTSFRSVRANGSPPATGSPTMSSATGR